MSRTEGTVHVDDDGDQPVAILENMDLYDGYKVGTETSSYAWLDLDEERLTKLDEESKVRTVLDGKETQLWLENGSLFFNIAEPLAEDETLEIRTSSMVTGIRGTAGWVRVPDAEHMEVYVLEGTVECFAEGAGTNSGGTAEEAETTETTETTETAETAEPENTAGTGTEPKEADTAETESAPADSATETAAADLDDVTENGTADTDSGSESGTDGGEGEETEGETPGPVSVTAGEKAVLAVEDGAGTVGKSKYFRSEIPPFVQEEIDRDEALRNRIDFSQIADVNMDLVNRLAGLCEAGNFEEIFNLKDAGEFEELSEMALSAGRQIFMQENGKGLGLYPRGIVFAYYGDYQGDVREGEGLWFCLKPRALDYSYSSGSWADDFPNGYQENVFLKEDDGGTYIMSGNVVNGLFDGPVKQTHTGAFADELYGQCKMGKWVVIREEESYDSETGEPVYVIAEGENSISTLDYLDEAACIIGFDYMAE